MTQLHRLGNVNVPRLAQRGHKECADIIAEAIKQGYAYRDPIGNGANQHAYLIPPNGDRPVGISSTPSCKQQRNQIIRLLRRSGFRWPPPENKKIARVQAKKEQSMLSLVTNEGTDVECWQEIIRCSDFEISNGGRAREKYGHRLLTSTEHGTVFLFDDDGHEREKSLVTLCKKAFGHHPKKNLVVSEEPPVDDSADDEEETIVTVAATGEQPKPWSSSEDHYPSEELDSGQQDEAQRDYEATVRREIVLIEGIAEGYEVDENANVHSAPNSRRKTWQIMTPTYSKTKPPSIALRNIDGKKQIRTALDEIVLEAFEPRPAPHWYPEHVDGDLKNCHRFNLRWVEGALPEEPAVPEEPTTDVVGDSDVVDVFADVDVDSIGESPFVIQGEAIRDVLLIEKEQPFLPVRVFNLLRRGGYETYADLAEVTASRLMMTERGWTEKDVEGLRKRMEVLGLTLERGELPYPDDEIEDQDLRILKHKSTGITVLVNGDGSLDHQPVTADNAEIYSKLFARIKRG